jgi:putative molybdopterin biosynthesis protein
MPIYLHDIPLPEAQANFRSALEEASHWKPLGIEDIPLDENACGRILAEPIWARLSSPHYHASAMDGYALRSEETKTALPSRPILLKLNEGAEYVDTGDPLPDWANAVIPVELVELINDQGEIVDDRQIAFAIRLRSSLTPWSHVRPMGEDIVATQLVLPSAHILRPADLGAVAACGHSILRVYRRPRVAVLPTGSELIPVGKEVSRGDIIEYNSIVIAAMILSMGGIAERYAIIPDRFDLICEKVQKAADENDLVLLNAGTSAGSEDLSAKVISQLGTVYVHGVAVRPGHPVILGMITRSSRASSPGMVPIIGVPGYPVSAALTIEIFAQPLINLWIGKQVDDADIVEGDLVRKITSPGGDDDFVRVVVGKVGERTQVAPLARGAGVITSLSRADGIVIIPRGVQGLEAGTKVKVKLYRKPKELEGTIFAIGSHDISLDLLAQYLAEQNRRLVSSNVGSLAGLIALQRGEAHLAGSHLLNPENGEYNTSYIRQYLSDLPVKLITWVLREQGLIVQRDNPKSIQNLKDLARADVRFINRQRGAGTRVLLDFNLQKLDISPLSIHGYEQEEYTHLSVAAAVSSGRADCGMGVNAAASALGLSFIPLFQERYDLAIPCKYLEGGLLEPLFEVMNRLEFRNAVEKLPGYSTSQMGVVVNPC